MSDYSELKNKFKTDDNPTGDNYAELIDLAGSAKDLGDNAVVDNKDGTITMNGVNLKPVADNGNGTIKVNGESYQPVVDNKDNTLTLNGKVIAPVTDNQDGTITVNTQTYTPANTNNVVKDNHDGSIRVNGNSINPVDYQDYSKLVDSLQTINVVNAGIDNTGKTDVSDALSALAASSTHGLYFPTGVYLISKPIQFPYLTTYPYSIELSSNAHIVATATMDYMFKLGEIKATPDGLPYLANKHTSELYQLKGGCFHGNLLAGGAIQTSEEMTGYKINDITLDGCTNIFIHLQKSKYSNSHDGILTHIRINYVHAEQDASMNAIGIQADGGDWELSSSYFANLRVGVYSDGFVTINDTHLFTGWGHQPATAIICPGGLIGNNVYIDSYDIGISTANSDTSSDFSRTFIVLTNLFYFEWTGHDTTYPVRVIDTLDSSSVRIANVRTEFSTARGNDGSCVIYTRKEGNPSVRSAVMPALSITGLDDSANKDVEGTTNRIGDMLYSGASQDIHTTVVTNGTNYPAGTGKVIGWIPKPVNNNDNSTQNMILSANNEYIEINLMLRVVNVNGQLVVDGTALYSSQTSRYMHVGVGDPQSVNGIDLMPIYLYNSSNNQVWVDDLKITPISSNWRGFLFPKNPFPTPIALSTSIMVASTDGKNITVS